MKLFSILSGLAWILLSVTACGRVTPSNQVNANTAVAATEYFAARATVHGDVHTSELICRDGSSPYPNPRPYPPPRDRTACIDSVCNKIGRFNCDTQSEINQVSKLCPTDVDSACLDNICKKIGSFECDTLNEISEVSKVCASDLSLSCVDSVCNRIGSFSCDTIGEIQQVANSCK